MAPWARKEERPARLVRFEIAGPGRGVLPRQRAQGFDIGDESPVVGVDHVVGAVIRSDPAGPLLLDRLMIGQRVESAFGGGDLLDVESLEQRARPERRRRECGVDRVVVEIGGLRAQPRVDAEDGGKDMVEP
ncbi:MAG: hypothetical protein WDM81_01235 [Rhizomicrobium sp.]